MNAVGGAVVPIVVEEDVTHHKAVGGGDLNAVAHGVAHRHSRKMNALHVGKADQLTLEDVWAIGRFQAVLQLGYRVKPHLVAVSVPDTANDLDVLIATAAVVGKMRVLDQRTAGKGS